MSIAPHALQILGIGAVLLHAFLPDSLRMLLEIVIIALSPLWMLLFLLAWLYAASGNARCFW